MKRKKLFVKWLSLLAIIGLLSTQSIAFADSGDDSLSEARIVDVNQTYTGQISDDYDDVNYYRFSLSTAGKLDITLSNVSNKGWSYRLYDSQGKQFPWYGNTVYSELATGNTVTSVGLPAGEYYLSVSRYTGNVENVPYTLRLGFTAGSTFEQEGNDTLSTASPMTLNQDYQAHLQYDSDVDFYKFNLPKTGKLSITLPNISGKSWTYRLIDSQGNEYPWYGYTDYNELAKGNSVTSIGLPAGDYYLKVSRYTGSTDEVPYTLQLKYTAGDSFEIENNDTLSTATPIVVNKAYDSSLQHDNDVDFYKFKLPKSGKLSIVLPNVSGKSWTYRLIDSEGNEYPWYGYTDYSELVKGVSSTSVGLPAGDYYLRVSRYTGDVDGMSYNLQLKFTAGDTFEKESNDTLSTATAITVNKLYEASLVTDNDYDYYRFNLATKAVVNLGTVKDNPDSYMYTNITNSQGSNYDISGGKVTLPAGTYYVRISGYKNGYKMKVNAASLPLTSKQAVIVNKKGTASDSLTVQSVKKGDVIKVYSKQGKLLSQATVASGTKVTLKPALSAAGGDLFVSITSAGLQESSKLTVKYGKEK